MTVAPDTAREQAASTRERLRNNPRPAAIWIGIAAILVALEGGSLLQFLASFTVDTLRALPSVSPPASLTQLEAMAKEIPTLLSRKTIPNNGYYSTETQTWITGPAYYDPQQQEWVGTFMGLEPAYAWAIRVALVFAYTFTLVGWTWVGYQWYRRYYRVADWTPRDDVIDRLRNHYWGLFGAVIVLLFMTLVFFGPAMAPTTNQINNIDPYSYQIKYYDEEAGEVKTAFVGDANRDSTSKGSTNVGPMEYDDYGRFHPFGTMPSGQDLFTFIMYGARLSLIIGLLAIGLSTIIATSLAMISAYYKGQVDLSLVLISDAIFALPGLLLLIMLSVLLSDTWIAQLYKGGFLLALIFAFTGWPGLWRAVRGPALQTAERDWVDAAKSFGQTPGAIMRKHMLPYITGYLLVYGSMSLGGAIIGIAGLSYLGLGVNPPTPEWGRAISMGQRYIGTPSWHIAVIPGLLITLIVIGFNALGDGIRDAIDPQSDAETADTGGVERGGGA